MYLASRSVSSVPNLKPAYIMCLTNRNRSIDSGNQWAACNTPGSPACGVYTRHLTMVFFHCHRFSSLEKLLWHQHIGNGWDSCDNRRKEVCILYPLTCD